MLDILDRYDRSSVSRRNLVDSWTARLQTVLASKGRGDATQVARAEADVKANPAGCIRFNDLGSATVYAAGRAYQGGRFEIPRLCELRSRALTARERAGRCPAELRLWVLDGTSPLTDIGTLQATAAPGTLFQAASQFNCLESPGRFVTDVAEYFHDPTQGPRASISAFPGTIVRHYAAPAPDGGRFVQVTDGPQIDLLADVCEPGIARVHNGYLRSSDVVEPPAFARALEDRFEAIRLGVHDTVEVVLGHDWKGAVEGAPYRTIAQVFTSTLAAGMYSELDGSDPAFATICQQLQRAAYLGTLLAAAALGKDRVVLTLIGGGVFANPIQVIWNAILWATDQVRHMLHRDLVVIVNGRNLGEQLPRDEILLAVQSRGGGFIRIQSSGAIVVDD